MTNTAVSESALFQAAVRLPAEQRAAYLDQACGENDELRRELESLLTAHNPEASFMAGPAAAMTKAAKTMRP